jgi:hypothetical protein
MRRRVSRLIVITQNCCIGTLDRVLEFHVFRALAFTKHAGDVYGKGNEKGRITDKLYLSVHF